ncbi:CLUMA_CG019857, isoform A [Clunio marinus]|uniref:CLUMA_CG019857, isoform A n=1 Tax=Clunio marinus TaxID=568069 RepID=A0A1J1J572_9DIPT|nr:CLUMA_CG019857, isoform A [Clunio marinus]
MQGKREQNFTQIQQFRFNVRLCMENRRNVCDSEIKGECEDRPEMRENNFRKSIKSNEVNEHTKESQAVSVVWGIKITEIIKYNEKTLFTG